MEPWRGLLVYEEEHASVFYGRDASALDIVSHLEERGVAILVGASGTGKSSLVRAGVLPKIRARQAQLLREPTIFTVVPGPLESTLKARPRGLDRHVTLFVDQLEEVADLDYGERTRFLDALVAFAGDPNEAFLVATLRADRIGVLLEHAGFRALLPRALEPIAPVGKTELREIITRPLEGRDVTIDPALVERILNDVGEDPGALALVSQLLSALWETRDLSIASYEAVGGVSGVLEKRADEARDAAGAGVDDALVKLARRGDDGIFTRRRLPASELADARPLLAPFIERRLVVAGEQVEIAHEALLRSWPYFKALLERESEAIALRQEIERAAATGELWSDATSKLRRAEELSGRLSLGERERDFLRSSRRAVLLARRRTRLGVGALALLGVVALGFAFWAMRASRRAKAAELEAQSRSRDAYASAAIALARSPRDRKNAPFPALEALAIDHRLRQTPDRDRAAIIGAAYAARRHGEHLVVESARPLRDAAYRADGAEVAIVGDEPMLRVVDMATEQVTATPLAEGALAARWTSANELTVVTTKAIELRTDRGTKLVSRHVVNEEGLDAASIGKKGLVLTRAGADTRVWAPSGSKRAPGALLLHDDADSYESFPDSMHAFAARALEDAVVVATRHEVADGKRRWSFDPHETIAAVEPDLVLGRMLVAAGKVLYALDAQSGQAKTLLKMPFVIHAIAPGPDAAIALAGEDGRIRIFDGRTLDRLEELDGHSDGITALAWAPRDPRRDVAFGVGALGVVSTSLDHTATIWKLGAPGLVRLLHDLPEAAQAPQFTAAGEIGVFGGREVAIYDDRTGQALRRFAVSSEPIVNAGYYDRRVLGITRDGSLYSWDAKTKQSIGRADLHASHIVLARDVAAAVACRESECTVLDGDAREVAKFPAPNGVQAQIIASNGKLVAVAGADGAWRVFDVDAKAQREAIPSDAPIPRAAFANGRLLVAGAASVEVHDPESAKLVATLDGNLNGVSDDGRIVRTLENGTAHYFHTANGWKLGSNEVGTSIRVLDPRGQMDAIFDVTDRTVRVRRTDGRRDDLAKLVGHTDAVTAVSWSADSRFLATTSEDRTLRVWDIEADGREIAVIDVEETPAEMHLSRDGTRIVTSDLSNRVVRVYDVSLDGAIALACKVAKPAATSVCRPGAASASP
jgi:WD40 repeat protein